MAVAIMRGELSATALRQAAARSRDANAARRMLAIALVLDGQSREDAAESCGMDRQALRDWVHRYNADGIAGLANRRAPGPAPRLSPAQEAAVARWVEEGPELGRDGVVRASSSCPDAATMKPAMRFGRTEAHPTRATPVTSAQVW